MRAFGDFCRNLMSSFWCGNGWLKPLSINSWWSLPKCLQQVFFSHKVKAPWFPTMNYALKFPAKTKRFGNSSYLLALWIGFWEIVFTLENGLCFELWTNKWVKAGCPWVIKTTQYNEKIFLFFTGQLIKIAAAVETKENYNPTKVRRGFLLSRIDTTAWRQKISSILYI